MIHQILNSIPVITPKGRALAHFLIDYGPEHHLQWVCAQDDTGECWTWPNPQIRFQKNITMGRENISTFYEPESVKLYPDPFICEKCGGLDMRRDSYSRSGKIVSLEYICEKCGHRKELI